MTNKQSKIFKLQQIIIVLYTFSLKIFYDCFIVNTIKKIFVCVCNQIIIQPSICTYAIAFFTKFIVKKILNDKLS